MSLYEGRIYRDYIVNLLFVYYYQLMFLYFSVDITWFGCITIGVILLFLLR